MRSGALPILTYHALDDSGSVTSTGPRRFAETLAALASAGARCFDLSTWIASGRPAVDRGFALAFDDGLRSVRLAVDAMARFGFTATAFLVAGRMGGDNAWPGQPSGIPRSPVLGWGEIEDLHAAGFRFAAHGMTHARLDRISPEQVESEMASSRAAIEERTGRPCDLFAYPYGVAPAVARAAARRHFAAAFGTRLDEASSADPIDDVARIDAYYLQTPRALDALVAGRLAAALRARRIARSARLAFGRLASPAGATSWR